MGDGNSFINFAIPIVGNEEFIHELSKIIEDGTIDSAASLDLFLKEILVGERSYHRDIVNAIKKRRGNKGFLVPRSRGQNNDTRGISALSERSGRSAAPRGESGNSNESGNQELTQTLTTANGEMVADVNEAQGQALFSLRTYREGGRDVLAEFLATRVADRALTEREASEMMQQMDDIYNLCMTMKDEYAPFGQWSEAKVVEDEKGNPKVVYHQTNHSVYINCETGQNWDELYWRERMEWDERDDWDDYWEKQDFNTFSRVNARTTQELDGFFFAPEYDEYHEYVNRTIEAFLNIENPASREDYNIDSSKNNAGRDERIRLQNEEYDGVINEEDGVIWEYVAFNPNQIKSADPVTYDDAGNVRCV